MEPLETFTDDPLRVLRSIRFSARYGFKIFHTLVDAASETRVNEELNKKISRERIGKELSLMLCTHRFSYSLECIHMIHLWNAIFKYPSDITEIFEWDPEQSLACVTNLERVLAIKCNYFGSDSEAFPEIPHSTQCALMAAIFVPIAPFKFLTAKRKLESLVSYIMLNSIKTTSKDNTLVSKFLGVRPQMISLVANRGAWSRRSVGSLLLEAGEFWRDIMLLSLASVLPPMPMKKSLTPELPSLELSAEGKKLVEMYDAFEKYVADEKLENAWASKTLFNGKQIAGMLGTKAGPWVTKALRLLQEWQFENPNATADEAKEWIVENKETLTIPPTPVTPSTPLSPSSCSVPSSPTSPTSPTSH